MNPKDTSLSSPIHILRRIFHCKRPIKSIAITICKLELQQMFTLYFIVFSHYFMAASSLPISIQLYLLYGYTRQ
jgi:hypothetical protein